LGLARPRQELAALHSRLVSAIAAHRPVPESLIVNDLQPAALSLRPQIAPPLELAREVGADQAILCGSGPTVIGIFWGPEGLARARRGAERLHSRFPGATASGVVGRGVLAPAPNE
jgi:4-diphosphocytidyl-2-C-methyl-D-erythritol kinase